MFAYENNNSNIVIDHEPQNSDSSFIADDPSQVNQQVSNANKNSDKPRKVRKTPSKEMLNTGNNNDEIKSIDFQATAEQDINNKTNRKTPNKKASPKTPKTIIESDHVNNTATLIDQPRKITSKKVIKSSDSIGYAKEEISDNILSEPSKPKRSPKKKIPTKQEIESETIEQEEAIDTKAEKIKKGILTKRVIKTSEAHKSNPKLKELALVKNNSIIVADDLLSENNFIRYIENLQIKTYKSNLFQKNDKV